MKKTIVNLLLFLPFSFIILLPYFFKNQEDEEEDFLEEDEQEYGYIRVAMVDNKAYWIINNQLYEADMIGEEIDRENSRVVNAFDLDFKQVSKMMEILDGIQDWKN